MQIISLIFSLIAVSVSIYSIYETRRANRLKVKPYLVAHEVGGNNSYSYCVVNKGLGQAFFDDINYYKGFEPVDDKNFTEFYSGVGPG